MNISDCHVCPPCNFSCKNGGYLTSSICINGSTFEFANTNINSSLVSLNYKDQRLYLQNGIYKITFRVDNPLGGIVKFIFGTAFEKTFSFTSQLYEIIFINRVSQEFEISSNVDTCFFFTVASIPTRLPFSYVYGSSETYNLYKVANSIIPQNHLTPVKIFNILKYFTVLSEHNIRIEAMIDIATDKAGDISVYYCGKKLSTNMKMESGIITLNFVAYMTVRDKLPTILQFYHDLHANVCVLSSSLVLIQDISSCVECGNGYLTSMYSINEIERGNGTYIQRGSFNEEETDTNGSIYIDIPDYFSNKNHVSMLSLNKNTYNKITFEIDANTDVSFVTFLFQSMRNGDIHKYRYAPKTTFDLIYYEPLGDIYYLEIVTDHDKMFTYKGETGVYTSVSNIPSSFGSFSIPCCYNLYAVEPSCEYLELKLLVENIVCGYNIRVDVFLEVHSDIDITLNAYIIIEGIEVLISPKDSVVALQGKSYVNFVGNFDIPCLPPIIKVRGTDCFHILSGYVIMSSPCSLGSQQGGYLVGTFDNELTIDTTNGCDISAVYSNPKHLLVRAGYYKIVGELSDAIDEYTINICDKDYVFYKDQSFEIVFYCQIEKHLFIKSSVPFSFQILSIPTILANPLGVSSPYLMYRIVPIQQQGILTMYIRYFIEMINGEMEIEEKEYRFSAMFQFRVEDKMSDEMTIPIRLHFQSIQTQWKQLFVEDVSTINFSGKFNASRLDNYVEFEYNLSEISLHVINGYIILQS